MRKEVTLVLVPVIYSRRVKLEYGMLMAFKRKKLQPEKYDYNPFYLTEDGIKLHPNIRKNWTPVEAYLICDDDFESEDLLMFSVNGRLCSAYFDEILGAGINWVKKVMATPEEIGNIPIEQIRTIIKNGESSGKCEIEMEESGYNPDHNAECLGCDEPSQESCTCISKPKLVEEKVVIIV